MHRLWARGLGWVLLAAFLAAPFPAFADNTADEADIAFRLGNQAFGKRDYEKALASYFLSYRLVANRNVLFNIARCYEALKEFDQAYRYYNDMLGQKDLPANDKRDVQKALAQLGPRVALLKIDSKPQGADVFIDREDLGSRGKTPLTVALTPGGHEVKVRLQGHHLSQATVTLLKGREVKRSYELKPVVGSIDVQGSPVGAVIRETDDGPELGRVPSVLTLTPGKHVLLVTAPGFAPGQYLVEAKPDESTSVKVTLTELAKAMGKLIVTANREGALVRVNGKESGFTPTVLSLPVGEYDVEVAMKELRTHREKVSVKSEQEVRVTADLRYAPPDIRAASKSLLSVDEAPASITVMTSEEIRSFGYQTLAEALQAVRGFYLTDDRIYSYVGVRGFTPPGDLNARVLILWDGHPMNDVWAGQGYAGTDLDVDLTEVERIEVVRGPGSALYGTGAFFAVINVVPRETLTGRNVEGTVGAGGQRGLKARLAGGLAGEKSSVLVSAGGLLTQGAELTVIDDDNTVLGLDGERVLNASVRAKWGGFSVHGHLNQRRKQIPTQPLGSLLGVPGTNFLDARGFAEARYEGGSERVNVMARLYYDASRYEGTYAAELLPDNGVRYEREFGGADWFGLEAKGRFALFAHNQLSVGLEGQGQLVAQRARNVSSAEKRQRFLLSAYLLDEWRVTSWFTLTAGLRIDKYFDLSALPVTPRLGLVFRPYRGGLLKVVGGQAFRAPNTYELYFSDGLASFRPPGLLSPETITTFELEHTHDITEELRLTVGGYFNMIDRLVELARDEERLPQCGVPVGSEQCFYFRNSANRIFAVGAETALRWQPGRFTLVEFSYAYVQLRGSDDISRMTPSHVFAARALVPLAEASVRLSGQAVFQSSRGTDVGAGAGEALLLNFGLAGDVGRLRYFAGVKNLLDIQYRVPVVTDISSTSAQQYGRSFMVEAALSY